MNMFLIIGRDGGLEISPEELVAALQQAADLSCNEGWNACRIAVMQLNRKS